MSVGLGNLDLILLVWGTSKVLEQKKFRDILFLFERNLWGWNKGFQGRWGKKKLMFTLTSYLTYLVSFNLPRTMEVKSNNLGYQMRVQGSEGLRGNGSWIVGTKLQPFRSPPSLCFPMTSAPSSSIKLDRGPSWYGWPWGTGGWGWAETQRQHGRREAYWPLRPLVPADPAAGPWHHLSFWKGTIRGFLSTFLFNASFVFSSLLVWESRDLVLVPALGCH